MEVYRLGSAEVHIALFTSLKNAGLLRNRLVVASQAGSSDEAEKERSKLNFAFIDASMITSRLHLLTAINQALLAKSAGALKTNTVHSEILWALEPGNNITDSLKYFGLSGTTSNLLIVQIQTNTALQSASSEQVYQSMQTLVDGQLGSMDLLGHIPTNENEKLITNTRALRKRYKVNQDEALLAGAHDAREELRILDELCTGSVALKATN